MKKSFKTKRINQGDKLKVNSKAKNQNEIKELENFYNGDHFQKPLPTNSRILVYSLVIAVLFGFFAGFLSLLLFLSGAFSSSRLFSWLDINSLFPAANLVIERQEKTTVLEDERVAEVSAEVSPAVVGIFNYKTSSNDIQKNIYQKKDFLGNGLILTNDGWVVTTNNVVKADGQYSLVTQDHKIYKVKRIERDGSLGLMFLKVEAENLPVISMGRLQDVYEGEKVVSVAGLSYFNRNLTVDRVANRSFQITNRLIFNTENYNLFISLARELKNEFWGAPVFNLNKQVIGLISDYHGINYIIPADYLKRSFNQLLTQNKIERTYLGIEYIDLARVVSHDLNYHGALIMNIKKDSPLSQKGLGIEAGDIIIKIGDDIINENNNLTNLVQEYKMGDKITLTILDKDNNEEMEVEIVL